MQKLTNSQNKVEKATSNPWPPDLLQYSLYLRSLHRKQNLNPLSQGIGALQTDRQPTLYDMESLVAIVRIWCIWCGLKILDIDVLYKCWF